MLAASPRSPFAQLSRWTVALAIVVDACSGGGSKDSTPTLPSTPTPVLSTVQVALSPATIQVGQTAIASASGLDQNGNSITIGTVVWSSGSPTIATASASGTVTGTVTGVAPGQAQIIATSGGKQGLQLITVVPAAVASVTVAPPTGSLVVGGTLTLTATALDANGNALGGQVYTWTSTNPSVVSGAFVGNVLTATGVGVGSATITATSGGKSGTSQITVTSGATSVSLSVAGQSAAFLNSPNFTAALTVQAGSQYLIAVVNTDAASTSLEDFTLSTSFGAASAAGIVPRTVGPIVQTPSAASGRPGVGFALGGRAVNMIPARRNQTENHSDVLEDNRRIFARYGNPRDAWVAARRGNGQTTQISASVAQTVGSVNKVYVRKTLNGSCNAVDSIGARTVAVGQHVIVLADTNRTTWPQAYRPDTSFYQAFANEYDQITYPHLLNYIGNPLAYDASLSGTGKVAVTITPELNNLGGVPGGGTYVAFVNPCDFFPFVGSGASTFYSNQTEMMYSLVPSASGYSVAGWEAELRATAAHESKHIVSYADRVLLGALGSDEVWLEEGLAQVSSEIWERHFNQATWKGHATFVQTVACEINLAPNYPCDASGTLPSALMGSHLPFFFTYLQRESTSNTEGLGVDGQANYGAAWAFARWAIDQYGSSGEGTFIQSLINTTTTGLTTLSTKTGQSIPLLLTYWNAASAIFQTPGYTAADVRITNPSFNFADIFRIGQTSLPPFTGWVCGGNPCGLFTNPRPPPPIYPVQPILFSSGSFSRTVHAVPGTSASFFLLSGSTAGIETLNLLNGSGGALSPSSGFRVLILRVQ
jgi:hypothetical protein